MVAQTLLVTQGILERWPAAGHDVCVYPPEPGSPCPHTYPLRLTYLSVPEFSVQFKNMILNSFSFEREKPEDFNVLH